MFVGVTWPSEALIGVPLAPVMAIIPPAIAWLEPDIVNVYEDGSLAPANLYQAWIRVLFASL